MTKTLPPIEELVLHRDTMLLIDSLVDKTDTHATAELRISESSTFFRKGKGVPAYVGLEYMAQTVAAFDGAQQVENAAEPSIGFLLGSRRYLSDRDYFGSGDHLLVDVEMVFNDGNMASFDCSINVNGEPAVSATLNVYRPGPGEFPPMEKPL